MPFPPPADLRDLGTEPTSSVSCIGKRILYLLSNWGHIYYMLGFPRGSASKESTCNVRDLGPIPGLGRSPEEGNSYTLQYSGLVNSMDCIVHGVTEPDTTDFHFHYTQSAQFSSVAQSCPTRCDPMNRSTPGLPVHHQLPEFTQTHVHRVGDAIQPSHLLSSLSPPAPNPSQHQGLFQ